MKRKNIVGSHTHRFTPRQYKHFLRHGPSWRYHYDKETRRRIRLIVAAGAIVFALLVYYFKHK